MPSIAALQDEVAARANALMKDPRIQALYSAIWELRSRGIMKKKAKNMTLEEAEGFLNGTCTFETCAASRGTEAWILAAAWSHEHFKLTGIVSIPVHATKAEEAEHKAKKDTGKLN